MSVLAQDVRYALRSLSRAPGFTLVALLTLALGIGGTTAIFSVVDGILLRPLPYPEPSAIVAVSRTSDDSNEWGGFSAGEYLAYKKAARSFAAIAGMRPDVVDLTGDTQPVRVDALETTSAFFDVFATGAQLGRTYTDADLPHGPRIAVISDGFWRRQFGSDPHVVGRAVRLNGIPTTVVGVMPPSFGHPSAADLWMLAPTDVPTSPVAIEGDPLADREVQYFQVIGRLGPNVSVAQANDDLRRLAEQAVREFPDGPDDVTVSAMPLQERMVGDVRTALLVLLGAVGFVLLIACANVASLLLARGTARRRELAVRTALGAGKGRLIRQLLTESLVLASVGGMLGIIVAYWGVDLLVAVAPESIPRLEDVRLDPRVTVFAVAASAVVGMLFGIVPAFQGARAQVTDALKDGGRTGTARTRTQRVLVVAEVALALVLLIGAGLMLTSFARLRAVDPGFTASGLVVVSVPLPQARYSTPAQATFYTQLAERLRENPITARSALGFPTPFSNANASGAYDVVGAPPRSSAERVVAQIGIVTPGYFQTMGIPLLRGRDLSLTDTRDRGGVAIVNQHLAAREWPDQDPIGKRLTLGNDPADSSEWLTVVGVVGDSKRQDLQTAPGPAVYVSHHTFTLPYMSVIVRSGAGEAAIGEAVRAAVRTLDRELPIGDVDAFDHVLARATGQPRFRALLIGSFAVAALLLAGVGLYGLISYTVAQRVPEIGVRLALGATPGQVGRLVLGQGLALAGAGVAVGLVGAVGATRLLEGLLFSVSATDPTVYAGLAALLLTIAALACYLPARRAMRVDPMTALRAD
jgi:putative ABC transport system permease protein